MYYKGIGMNQTGDFASVSFSRELSAFAQLMARVTAQAGNSSDAGTLSDGFADDMSYTPTKNNDCQNLLNLAPKLNYQNNFNQTAKLEQARTNIQVYTCM